MKKFVILLIMLCLSIGLFACSNNTQQVTVQDVSQIYDAKNPYIGDNVADAKLLGLLTKHFSINEPYTIELQTSAEPYALIIHFDSKPDDSKIQKLAAVTLCLIDNCGEIKWDDNKSGNFSTVTIQSVNEKLQIDNIKEYSASKENLEELFTMLK